MTAALLQRERPTAATVLNPPRFQRGTQLSDVDILANEAGSLRSMVRLLSQDVAQVHDVSLRRQLEGRTNAAVKKSSSHLLGELAARGFSWISVARIADVSIPEIRKWRLGKELSEENRRSLALLVAFVGLLEEDPSIRDGVSWLEISFVNSTFTGIDVLATGHSYKLMQYAAGHISQTELLDSTFPTWRDTLNDSFEVYEAQDGERAIRMRTEG